MARYNKRKFSKRPSYGKPFRKKSSRGKFRRGTLVRYKYENGRRVGCVKAKR